MIALLILIPLISFAQPALNPIIDQEKLEDESLRRTVFIQFFEGGNIDERQHATGIVLKDGYIMTNAHVLRPFLQDKKTSYTISGYGKTVYYAKEVNILACDETNDICLLKTDLSMLKYFPVEAPSYRTITKSNPVGLYEKELIYFTGGSNGMIELKKARNVGYKTTAYDSTVAQRRWGIDAIELECEKGGQATNYGDSGGPVFDNSLTLFGMVRDFVIKDTGNKSMAVPANKIREFYEANKDNKPIESLIIQKPRY